jgi:hypothetical protein
MDANEYQKLALRTEKTPEFAKHLSRLLHALLGVCTEAGELQDMVKKHLIYGREFDRVNVLEECGDILWYIALALDTCGYDLEACMQQNINKLRVRFPDKFTEEQALTRDLPAERAALEAALDVPSTEPTHSAACPRGRNGCTPYCTQHPCLCLKFNSNGRP